jgi:hypothetical protein
MPRLCRGQYLPDGVPSACTGHTPGHKGMRRTGGMRTERRLVRHRGLPVEVISLALAYAGRRGGSMVAPVTGATRGRCLW